MLDILILIGTTFFFFASVGLIYFYESLQGEI